MLKYRLARSQIVLFYDDTDSLKQTHVIKIGRNLAINRNLAHNYHFDELRLIATFFENPTL